ncbi:MAG: sulfate ABC transporter permease subunit CysT [Acidobacteria bacterium]|nr:MAG: sulfate ABC transporter permease subunit CysT [Acidobacteriota bacterium]
MTSPTLEPHEVEDPSLTFPRPWGNWGLRTVAGLYLGAMILLPVAAILHSGFEQGLRHFWQSITQPIAGRALYLTLLTAGVTTLINAIMGTMAAYVLVRHKFPGQRILNAFIDMPFAIPTLVTGVMLVILYGPQGLFGEWFTLHGIEIVFAKPGIILALLLVTYPFTVRSVQPVLLAMSLDQEEAAYTLGASRWTTFWRIVLPSIFPAILTGSLLTFARAIGEFGSIVVVSGNIPGRTLTAPVHIFGLIESEDRTGASAISILLLSLSFTLVLLVDWLQKRREAARGRI